MSLQAASLRENPSGGLLRAVARPLENVFLPFPYRIFVMQPRHGQLFFPGLIVVGRDISVIQFSPKGISLGAMHRSLLPLDAFCYIRLMDVLFLRF
jgi:hypothetical protein